MNFEKSLSLNKTIQKKSEEQPHSSAQKEAFQRVDRNNTRNVFLEKFDRDGWYFSDNSADDITYDDALIFVDQMGIDELKILFSNVMRLFLLDNFLMHQSFSFHRDTHNNESRTQRNRRYRSTSSSECITDEHGENRLYPIE